MGEMGRIDSLISPAAYSIGHAECHIVAVACPAHEECILATVWPPRENFVLRRDLRLGIEGEDILFRIEAASFGGEGRSNSVGEGGARGRRRRRL